jgi:putative restriction endonuclease
MAAVPAKANWTRDELILAFNLYCKIPFGLIHLRNPEIIRLAKAIGRTPSSVSWKLANFARLDPALKARNISGATHGAKAEVEIWREFNGNWDKLAFESERLAAALSDRELVTETLPEGKDKEALVRVRVNQGFFRAAVLAAYDFKCCLTGLAIPDLLTASHIVPWSRDAANRTNPRNGLCLNALHDRAFDCGLITVTPEMSVKVSRLVSANSGDRFGRIVLSKYDGARIRPASRFRPDPSFLKFHNQHVFRR